MGGIASCCTQRESDGFPKGNKAHREESLGAALRHFREAGRKYVDDACGPAGMNRWEGACDFISALLLGMEQHCKQASIDAEVFTKDGPITPGEKVVTLTVEFDAKEAIAEIATRSHMGCDVRLDSPVKFSLLAPPEDIESEPLAVACEGWHFHVVPEIREMRWHLKQHMGEPLDPDRVYDWWIKNKDEFWPIETSKAHKVLAALFDGRAFSLTVPNSVKVSTLWSMLHAVSVRIERLDFAEEASFGLRVTATRGPAVEPDTEEDVQKCDEILQAMLVRDKQAGEIFAASSFNFVRLMHGHAVGQPGGCVKKLTKLLSAAHTWGPGDDGWQKHDDSWLATDQKNFAGRTTRENGRLVWRMPNLQNP